MKIAFIALIVVILGVSVAYAQQEPEIYLDSTYVHADGTREPTIVQLPLKKAPVQPLPIKRLD